MGLICVVEGEGDSPGTAPLVADIKFDNAGGGGGGGGGGGRCNLKVPESGNEGDSPKYVWLCAEDCEEVGEVRGGPLELKVGGGGGGGGNGGDCIGLSRDD